jgi:hypothetical protein
MIKDILDSNETIPIKVDVFVWKKAMLSNHIYLNCVDNVGMKEH